MFAGPGHSMTAGVQLFVTSVSSHPLEKPMRPSYKRSELVRAGRPHDSHRDGGATVTRKAATARKR